MPQHDDQDPGPYLPEPPAGGQRPIGADGSATAANEPVPGAVWGGPPEPPADDQMAGPAWGGPPAPPGSGNRSGKRWSWKKIAGASALAAAVVVGGTAAVTAAYASSSTTQGGQGGPSAAGYGFGPGGGQGSSDTDGNRRGGMAGLAGALHGEFVASTDSGGTQTRRLQRGDVTAVGNGSLAVTSTDGFAATYVVGSDLDVSSIAVGASVTVIATVDGSTVTAVSVTQGSGFAGAPDGQLAPPGAGGRGMGGGETGGTGTGGVGEGGSAAPQAPGAGQTSGA